MIIQNISKSSQIQISSIENPKIQNFQRKLDLTAPITLQLSQEGQQLSKLFKQFYEEYHSIEAIEKRQREQLEKEQTDRRLNNEFSLHVEYRFPENTLQKTIQKALEGKVVNASLYAAELASAIRSYISMPDKSVEERTAYREMALKQVEYIAENYFNNEKEAMNFLSEIIKYYENDILREKGYVVIDNSGIQPFKKYSSPMSNGEVSFYALAKKYIDKDYFERFMNGEGTPEESRKLLNQLQSLKKKYSKELAKEFERNEQQVAKLIQTTKSIFETFTWENGRVISELKEEQSYWNDVIEWNHRLLNLFF